MTRPSRHSPANWLISGAVAALASVATVGLLNPGFRDSRARAKVAVTRYASVARRRLRLQRPRRRLAQPDAVAALVVLGIGLAAACARLGLSQRRNSPFAASHGRGKRRIETIENIVEVDRPLRTVYDQWTQFEEFPRFMAGVKEVRQLDDAHLLWRAEVFGKDEEWEAEITEQEPDTRISWKSVAGARNAGTVRFEPMGAGRTRVRLTMAYQPEGVAENIGDALGAMRMQVARSVRDFKSFIEGRTAETGAWRGTVEDGVPQPREN